MAAGVLGIDNLTFLNPIGTTLAKLLATDDTITLSGSTGATTVQIKQLTAPVDSTDAANKAYVDASAQGLTWKTACKGGTVGLIVLGAIGNGSQVATASIDGNTYTITPGNLGPGARLIVKNQNLISPSIANGIYVVTLCTNPLFFFWARSADCETGIKATGSAVFVTSGTVNNDTAWMCPTDDATFGSTAITFVLFSTGGGSAVGPTGSIQVSADGLGAFGGISTFTFNQSTSSPTMQLGSDAVSTTSVLGVGTGAAQTTATVNIGTSNNATSIINLSQGTGTTAIAGAGSGLMTVSAVGAFRSTAGITSTVQLFNTTTTGGITTGTGLTSGVYTIGNSTMSGTITVNNAGTINIGANTLATSLRATGASGTIAVTSGAASVAATAGGVVGITSGAGNTSGAGGAVNITSGAGGATGTGGLVTIAGGIGGATSGVGASINISAGTATAGSVTGTVKIAAGLGTATVGNNGNVKLVTAFNATATGSLTTGIIGFYDSALVLRGHVEDDGSFYGLTFNATSDKTHKTNIKRLNNSLSKVRKIKGYSYNWKESFSSSKKEQYGVIAQDLEKEGLGFLVNGEEGNKSVNYNGLIALLLESIGELSEKIRILEKREKRENEENEENEENKEIHK